MKSRKSSKVKTVRLFNRYAWLVDTIYRHGKISFEEINKCWLDAVLNEDEEDIPLRTFHDHREAIQELFDVNIECDKRDGYKYYIEHTDDMRRRDIRNWMLNSFTVNNLMNECRRLKNRILFEDVPSGQRFLAPIIEAMRDGLTLEMTCKSFKWSEPEQFELQPYCLKLFKQRWYVLAQTGNYDTRNDWDNSFNYELNVFPLDWIQDLQQTDKPFDLPENFCPESYFHNAYGVQAPLDETFSQPCTVENVTKLTVVGTMTDDDFRLF